MAGWCTSLIAPSRSGLKIGGLSPGRGEAEVASEEKGFIDGEINSKQRGNDPLVHPAVGIAIEAAHQAVLSEGYEGRDTCGALNEAGIAYFGPRVVDFCTLELLVSAGIDGGVFDRVGGADDLPGPDDRCRSRRAIPDDVRGECIGSPEHSFRDCEFDDHSGGSNFLDHDCVTIDRFQSVHAADPAELHAGHWQPIGSGNIRERVRLQPDCAAGNPGWRRVVRAVLFGDCGDWVEHRGDRIPDFLRASRGEHGAGLDDPDEYLRGNQGGD